MTRDKRAIVVAVAAASAVAGCHVDPPLPPVATCAEVADHVYALLPAKSSRSRAVRDAMEHRCDADHWSERTRNCIAEEPALDSRRGCRETLTASQRTQLDAALSAISTALAPAQATTRFAAALCPMGVPECVELCVALDRFADCKKLPAQARETLKQSWLQALVSIAQLPLDAQRQVCSQQL